MGGDDHVDDCRRRGPVARTEKMELERIPEARSGRPRTHMWEIQQSLNRVISLVSNHTYTTLSDRLGLRPFHTNIKKLYIIHQFLSAVQIMHDRQVLHGFHTTQNISLTSWNSLVILNIMAYKILAALSDDDPSNY
jgi:serine/threonine protein kinase